MAIFKCKICGGALDVKSGERTAVCEYCGVRQSIPSFIEPKTQEIYDRANNYLMHNEFDKAENLYAQILFDNKTDADAYWNILMCHYGVTYVKDPKTGQYIPTCNRTLFRPIFNDPNYENAIKYANDSQRQLYIHNAQIIDNVQKGILSVSKREKPFDIFISYKETDINGTRTKDSIAAQDLYEKLTAEGYKVFFSRIILEDKIGTEYEPYIYAALASSKVMITVCSSKENIESVWVKNEWSRFLGFAAKDSTKTLIPLYFDMDKAELPEDFAYLPAYNMKLPGFEQELIRGIKKLIPLPVMQQEKRRKRKKIITRVIIAIDLCIIAGVICMIPWMMKLPDYNAAMQLYYDRNYPEATWAFDELDGYRDSEEMKEECELSWRKSLAITYSDGNGVVSQNGEAEIIDKYIEKNAFEINEHGRIISLTGGIVNNLMNYKDTFKTYHYIDVIYEDGNIAHAYAITESFSYEDLPEDIYTGTIEYDESQWHNIVQTISMDGITVALRSDGTVLFQNNANELTQNIEWTEELPTWKNVVRLFGEKSCLIGLKSDGTFYCAASSPKYMYSASTYNETGFWNAVEIIKGLKDIRSISVSFQSETDNTGAISECYMDISAITNNKNVITYINGEYKEIKQDNDLVDICLYHSSQSPDIYTLNSMGEISDINSDKIYLKDTVKLLNLYSVQAITRTGTVYQLNYDHTFQQVEDSSKAAVYDEWIEELG